MNEDLRPTDFPEITKSLLLARHLILLSSNVRASIKWIENKLVEKTHIGTVTLYAVDVFPEVSSQFNVGPLQAIEDNVPNLLEEPSDTALFFVLDDNNHLVIPLLQTLCLTTLTPDSDASGAVIALPDSYEDAVDALKSEVERFRFFDI